MYKKGAAIILIFNMVLLMVCFNIKAISINRTVGRKHTTTQAYQKKPVIEEKKVSKLNFLGLVTEDVSNQRILQVNVLERKSIIKIDEEDYKNLLKIVEAEAGGEDYTGKLLVANVIINRVQSDEFPNTVTEVIFQREKGITQFSPTRDGRMEKTEASEDTVKAVNKALTGEDISDGALYFVARKAAAPAKMRWFDQHLKRLFQYGGHEFYV